MLSSQGKSDGGLIQPLVGGDDSSDGHAVNKVDLTQVKDHVPGKVLSATGAV